MPDLLPPAALLQRRLAGRDLFPSINPGSPTTGNVLTQSVSTLPLRMENSAIGDANGGAHVPSSIA